MITEIRCSKCNSIIDFSSKERQIKEEVFEIIDEWAKGYDENHPIYYESIGRLKSMLKEWSEYGM